MWGVEDWVLPVIVLLWGLKRVDKRFFGVWFENLINSGLVISILVNFVEK